MGRTDALGEHLPPSCPLPGSRGGLSRAPGVSPERLAVLAVAICCHLPSEGRCRAGRDRGHRPALLCGAGGADGEPPPAFGHGIAISWRSWYWCPRLQGQPGSQPSWVPAADLSHCIFSCLHRAMASLLSTVCSFWVSWPLRPPQPKNDQYQQLGGTRPAGELEVSWLLPSAEQRWGAGAGLLSLFPLVAVHSSSQLHWPSQ